MDKIFELMQEYKHTDVFYVGVRPTVNLKGKSVDHSEIAQSTEIHSDNIELNNRCLPVTLCHENEDKELALYNLKGFRFFSMYFYKIQISYAGRLFVDQFLLERDSLCDGFFELYLKDLLATQFNNYFVTYHEANSKLIRTQRRNR